MLKMLRWRLQLQNHCQRKMMLLLKMKTKQQSSEMDLEGKEEPLEEGEVDYVDGLYDYDDDGGGAQNQSGDDDDRRSWWAQPVPHS
jgi:hypothetical protein